MGRRVSSSAPGTHGEVDGAILALARGVAPVGPDTSVAKSINGATRVPEMVSGTRLRQQLRQHVSMYVRQAALNPVVIERQPGVIDPQQVQYRRVKIVDVDDVFHSLVTEFVRRAEAEPSLDAGAG